MSKAEAARLNGAKSKGPTTAEGKARSAQNSTKHGLNSHAVVLATESHEEYEQLLADLFHVYRPADMVEFDLVHEIAATRWRLRRILRIETAAFDQAIERAVEENSDAAEATAFEALANSKTLSTLNRYEGRLRRAYERATAELRRIQAERTAVQNEPTAAIATPQGVVSKEEHRAATTNSYEGNAATRSERAPEFLHRLRL